MRPKAHIAVLTAFACAQLCCAPLLARPTRTIPRGPTHHLVPTPSSRESSREHATHHAAASHAAHPTSGDHLAVHRAAKSTASKSTARLTRPTRAQSSARSSQPLAARNETTPRLNPTDSGPTTDPATISRVHAWEQTQRETAAQSAIADADTSHPLNDSDDASTPLANTTADTTAPELPRIKSIEEEAATPVLLPSLYDARGHLVVPPPLYGSHEVLLHQNQMADRDGLTRIQNDAALLDLLRQKKLVALPESHTLLVDERLPTNRRFSRPWTAEFLTVLARDYYASFHEPLLVDSAVRTVQVQRRLLRTNGNAAPASGDTASPHLTGQAVDIAKHGLSLTQIAWMRTYLQPLIEQGKIDVEEEFQQACFHISVYRSYNPSTPPAPPHAAVAAARKPAPDPTY